MRRSHSDHPVPQDESDTIHDVAVCSVRTALVRIQRVDRCSLNVNALLPQNFAAGREVPEQIRISSAFAFTKSSPRTTSAESKYQCSIRIACEMTDAAAKG